MRRVHFAAICLFALSTGGALAADLPRAMPPVKAPVFVQAYSWTGFYAGINGGYGWGRSSWSAFATDADPSGGLAGLTAGYNWQAGQWVFGLEADGAWSDLKGGFTNAACPTGCETRNHWLATGRARLGIAFDRVMPFITGGVAAGDIHATQAGIGSVSDTNIGWTAGGGIEAAVVGNLTAKLEYLYVDLGSVNCTTCAPVTDVDFRTHVVRAGLNFRF